MNTLDAIDWEILNATADVWENVEQIAQMLPAGLANHDTLTRRILRLVEWGLLESRSEEGHFIPATGQKNGPDIRGAWFAMTPKGRAAWASSEHGTGI